jgi:tripartite-type tricarboxylate transporter receptor subunit TctC
MVRHFARAGSFAPCFIRTRAIEVADTLGRSTMPAARIGGELDRRRALALLGAVPLFPGIAFAEPAWPSRSVRYVLGFAAGGATDSLSRVFCQKMSALTGQQFVVENRVGAGGVIANDAVAKSTADGYTVGMGGIANNVIAIGTYAKLPYKPADDFTFISGLWQLPNILVAAKDFPASNAKDLLALLKQNPGKYNYASAGIGTTLHLSGEMMKSMAGVDVQHIPYKGGNPALMDLLAGRVNMLFDNLPGSLSAVREGSVKPIAVTGRTRSPALPDVPAMAELIPGYEMTSWACLCGPAGVPADMIAQIGEQTLKALGDADLKKRFEELGATAWPTSPAELAAFRASEEARLLPLIKAAGIVPQ